MKIALIGAVSSTLATLNKLVEHKMELISVLGYEPKDSTLVSGYSNLREVCSTHHIFYKPFTKINTPDVVQILKTQSPDVIFIVGLSQLVSEEILELPTLGCVGFHPTKLPKGRGRAPIAWLVLEESLGAANFFLMGKGADDGPIFVQKDFAVDINDDASSIESKILCAIDNCLDNWLPKLKEGIWEPVPQDETQATYYEKRAPEDGWIDWTDNSEKIDRLIKASAKPHPMAYSFHNGRKILINRSRLEMQMPIRGVSGRILRLNKIGEALVQCGDGLLWISEFIYDNGDEVQLRVGQKMGYYAELEIYSLRQRIIELEKKINNL